MQKEEKRGKKSGKSCARARVYTSSSEPVIYEDKTSVEHVVKELDIPSVRVDEVIDLTAGFFVRNVKIELEYPHLFSSSLDKPTWEPLFNFLNLMDTSTTITKAELIANDGDIQSTDDNLNIELNIGMAQRSNIIFPLSKSIPELKNIDGIIRFSHSHGEITLNVNYDLENALFEREDK